MTGAATPFNENPLILNAVVAVEALRRMPSRRPFDVIVNIVPVKFKTTAV
jgi:hypothetical protein